ncbi:hypothetical protein ACLBW2_10080 [Enterobacteriaceae bacterium C23F]
MTDISISQEQINKAISDGGIDNLEELLSVVNYMIRIRPGDLEDDVLHELKENQKTIAAALSEGKQIKIAKDDVLAVKDGIVVVDSAQLAKQLKMLLTSDTEGPYIKISVGWE